MSWTEKNALRELEEKGEKEALTKHVEHVL